MIQSSGKPSETTLVRLARRLIFPVDCLACGQEGDWLCPSCLADLPISSPERCVICGKIGEDGLCNKCRVETRLDGCIAPYAYSIPAIRELIKAVKYGCFFDGLRVIAPSLSREMISQLPRSRGSQPQWRLVPIPLSAEKQSKRGFNQAELLAKGVGGELWPTDNPLERNRDTDSQTTLLFKSQRLENVRGCFTSRKSAAGLDIVLCDDVVTSGATLGEAAKVLKRAGARTVWGLAIAHG